MWINFFIHTIIHNENTIIIANKLACCNGFLKLSTKERRCEKIIIHIGKRCEKIVDKLCGYVRWCLKNYPQPREREKNPGAVDILLDCSI
jgi:hypothetical protein